MNGRIIFIVITAILALGRSSYGAATGNEHEEDEKQDVGTPRSERAAPGCPSTDTENSFETTSDESDSKIKSEDVANYCTIEKAKQVTFYRVSKGFENVYNLLKSLLKQRCSGNPRSRKEEESEILANQAETNELYLNATVTTFIPILKIKPQSKNAVQKAFKTATAYFGRATNLLYDSIRLQFLSDREQIASQIDSMEPDSMAGFVNGVTQFFISMRQADPEKPSFLNKNNHLENKALVWTNYTFRLLFVATRNYLDSISSGSKSGPTRCRSFDLRETEMNTRIGLHMVMKYVFGEEQVWAGVPPEEQLEAENITCDDASGL